MDKENIDYAIEKLSELTNGVGGDYINFLINKLYLDTSICLIFLIIASIAVIIITIYTVRSGESIEHHTASGAYIEVCFVAIVILFISFIIICENMYNIYLSSKYPEMWAIQKFISK